MSTRTSSVARYIITGGAGFIGSALVRQLVAETDAEVFNVDKLTYAGNLDSLGAARHDSRHHFHQIDICDGPALQHLIADVQPDAVIHLAAESHVDRSIDGPDDFLRTNVIGTYTLLQEALRYWRGLSPERAAAFRFIHVSTDEVYGSAERGAHFTEAAPYDPSSPYSASKAAADHLARAWHRTYSLPAIITNCSNNYGPYQFPEKLIPHVILKALAGDSLPVYGTGANVRDWLHVDDHAAALRLVLAKGVPGRTYGIGGGNALQNIEVVRALCELLDELRPDRSGPHARRITLVPDRPGHDLRYAVDTTRIRDELGWEPREDLASGLRKTVSWYLDNPLWVERVMSGSYRGERLGLS